MTDQTPPNDRPLTAGDFPWIKPMAEALAGYEADYGEGLDDMHELGCIEDSRATPSFRIRVGHVRALAEILSRPATSAASEGEELDLYDDKVQAGIAWTLRQVGEALGLTTWTQGDGSESVEGDVGAEIHTILVDAGLRDPETNEMAALASPPVSERERELAVLLDNLVIAQSLSRELRTAATDQARSYLYSYRHPTAQPAGEGK